jgi:hypothetical protein
MMMSIRLQLVFTRMERARFNAMGGAFGALGGDVSAISVNPSRFFSISIDSEIGYQSLISQDINDH